MSVAVIDGFSTGNGAVHAREMDERFLGLGMDADEAHGLRENARAGCPISVSGKPWLPCDHAVRRKEDERIGEGHIAFDQPDFRKGLDRSECKCRGAEVCIACCTQKDLMGISENTLKQMTISDRRPKVIGSVLGEVFDLRMPRYVAENLGFLET